MIYNSCKDNSMLHYFIEAKNRAEAHRASRLLWGEGVIFKIYDTPSYVLSILEKSYIVKILDNGKLVIPSSYNPLNSREKSAIE